MLEKKKQNFANRFSADPEVKCYLPGVPRATYMPYPFQIVQSQKNILICVRICRAPSAPSIWTSPGPAPVDSWMGWSVGHWEGDTLVVDVTGLERQDLVRPGGQFPQ